MEHWGRAPTVVRPDAPELLQSVAPALQILMGGHLRPPFVQLVRGGEELGTSAFCETRYLSNGTYEAASPAKVSQHFANGWTVVVQSTERWCPEAFGAARNISVATSHWVDLYLYVTPASAQGFDLHFDPQDIFIWQLEGAKTWEVVPPSNRDYRAHPTDYFHGTASLSEEPATEFELTAGTALYLPSGWGHRGVAGELGSAHLTVGIVVRTIADVVAERAIDLIDTPESGSRVEASGFGSGTDPQAFLSALGQELENTSPSDHADLIYPQFPMSGGIVEAIGQMGTNRRRYVGW